MITLEQVDKLRKRANVSYAEAKEALEKCNGDLLDAMVFLEQQGKTSPPENFYPGSWEQSDPGAQAFSVKKGRKKAHKATENREEKEYIKAEKKGYNSGAGETVNSFFLWCAKALKMGVTNHLRVTKKGEIILDSVVIIPIILLLFGFWYILPLMVLGLFFGFRYSLYGVDLDKTKVNETIGKVQQVVDDSVQSFVTHTQPKAQSQPDPEPQAAPNINVTPRPITLTLDPDGNGNNSPQ